MCLATTGLAPPVDTARASSPRRTMDGTMKLQSGGTSTMLQRRFRASASCHTMRLIASRLVAAMTRKQSFRSSGR